MTPSQEQAELIEAYLANELSAVDMQTFEQDMAADPDLQAEVATYRQLRLGLKALAIEERLQRARQQVQANAEKADQLIDSQVPVKKLPVKSSRSGTSWTHWAAAASVVLGLGLGLYIYQQQTLPELAYADTATADQLTKSLPATLLPTDRHRLLDAIRGYKAGQYDAVIEELKIPPADRQTAFYQDYFLGLSYLASKQYDKAVAPLKTALGTSSVLLRQKANWFLALAYLKNKQPARAISILNTIRADTTHPYHDLAGKVYEKVK